MNLKFLSKKNSNLITYRAQLQICQHIYSQPKNLSYLIAYKPQLQNTSKCATHILNSTLLSVQMQMQKYFAGAPCNWHRSILVGLSVSQFAGQTVLWSVNSSVGQFVRRTVRRSVSSSVGQFVGRSVCLSVSPSIGQSVCRSVCLSVSPSVGWSVGPTVCWFISS